jgi:predicted dehydrogenase
MARILVVGTGSIGRRHINNLLELGADVSAFSYRREARKAINPLPPSVELVDQLSDALGAHYDAVVVANRTDLHLPVALDAARRGKALFIEKPIAISWAGIDELIEIVSNAHLVAEVGFMLRSNPNLRWIKEFVAGGGLGDPYYARAVVGQSLPQWRPGTDHRRGYAARRESGGGVIFDLIHELDLILWLVGEVEEVTSMTRSVPALEIETEAIAQIGLRLRSGVLAEVHLDYVRIDYERALELVGSDATLRWSFLDGTVMLAHRDRGYEIVHRLPDGFQRNSMYLNQMKNFLMRLTNHGSGPTASIEEGAAALRVALACHRSVEERRVVRPEEIDSSYRVSGQPS